jgi:hypothetical protein
MANQKRKPNNNRSGWSESWKALGIRAIDRGQLVHFGLISIGAIIAWKIESGDWVEIAKLAFSSGFFSAVGWLGFLGVSVGVGPLMQAQRKLYSAEMDRVCAERNMLQARLNGSATSSTGRLIEEEKVE